MENIFLCRCISSARSLRWHSIHSAHHHYDTYFLFSCGYKSIWVPTSMIYSFSDSLSLSVVPIRPRPYNDIHSFADFSLTSTCSVSARLPACARFPKPDNQFDRGICLLQPALEVMAISNKRWIKMAKYLWIDRMFDRWKRDGKKKATQARKYFAKKK